MRSKRRVPYSITSSAMSLSEPPNGDEDCDVDVEEAAEVDRGDDFFFSSLSNL